MSNVRRHMPRPKQREIERNDFEAFARDCTLPEGKIEYSDKPDVVIRGSRTIGIELANLHKVDGASPASERVQSLRRIEVIESAEQQHLQSGGRRIELWVDFDPDHPIGNVKKSAKSLAAIAATIADETEGHRSYSAFAASPEIRFLFHTGKEYTDAKWRPAQSYSVPGLLTTRVKEVVAIKSTKALSYQKCDEYWLLLIVDFWDPSQDQFIDWPAGERLGKTAFNRVLLYKPVFREIVEVEQ